MRKAISILFLVLCLLSLPGLIGGFRNAANASVLIGQGVFTLIMLVLAIHFWKPKAPKEEKK